MMERRKRMFGGLFPLSRPQYYMIILVLALALRLLFLPAHYGEDHFADSFESRVVLNDPLDMYTKEKVDQTPEEARTWSKEQSSPYPPVALFMLALFYSVGETTGLGLWGVGALLDVALCFVLLFLCYRNRMDRTFPLIVLNPFLIWRIWSKSDLSTLMMFGATVLAFFAYLRGNERISALLMGISISIKLLPVYFLRGMVKMRVGAWMVLGATLAVGLLLPFLIFKNYSYIYLFHTHRDIVPWYISYPSFLAFLALLFYVESKLCFQAKDMIGYAMVPLAFLSTLKFGFWKYLAWALAVPDARNYRNVLGFVLALVWILTGAFQLDVDRHDFSIVVALATVGLLFATLYLETKGKVHRDRISKRVDGLWGRIVGDRA